MSAMYERHEVSVRVALNGIDGKGVLQMYYPQDGGLGVPGGQIDAGDSRVVALERDMREELGITIVVTQADFYMRNTRVSAVKDHKIILGYTATVDSNAELPDRACDGGEERIVWLTRTEVEATDKIAPGYRDFVLKWWP